MQRVMIAMAISCKPKLLIADEPTTALRCHGSKRNLVAFKRITARNKNEYYFYFHDLALVSEIADRVVVMYQGNVVEKGTVFEIFKLPKAHYTKAFFASRPTLMYALKQLPTIASIAKNLYCRRKSPHKKRARDIKTCICIHPLLEVKNLKKILLPKGRIF